jgi:helicase MOV-10
MTHVVKCRPGTGKTVTVVEAIRQLLDRDPKVSILACAPSNSAADLIAEKLKVLGPSQLFRLNAASREVKTLPESLRDFSLVNGNLVFAIPSLERMMGFRVIVATCVSGGIPHGLGVRRGHFSHIVLDEVGQCMEPEAMIPIKTMADNSTNIILSGDSKQLGPSIRSNVSSALGLNKSYLSRLMAGEVYDLRTGTGSTYVPTVRCAQTQMLSNNPSELSSLSKISGLMQPF